MKHFAPQWIDDWCQANGWSDWFLDQSRYWAFPPNAVMPVPIPTQVLRRIKAEKGLCNEERIWCITAVLVAIASGVFSYVLSSPMPLVAAFAFCAITAARLEMDEM